MKYVILLVTVILLVSCSKKTETFTVETINGVKIYRNKNIPTNAEFKITPRELLTIEGVSETKKDSLHGFTFPEAITSDNSGNIYISDRFNAKIIKYDTKGNFIKSFSGKGQGPGEMLEPTELMIFNDTLYALDYTMLKALTFTLNGDFIRDINLPAENVVGCGFLHKINEEKFVGILRTARKADDKIYFTFFLNIFKKDFSVVKSLNSVEVEYNGAAFNGHDYVTPYAIGKDKIYVLKASTDVYEISVFDFDGKLLYKISKSYAKLPLSKDELDEFIQSRYKTYTDKSQIPKFENKFKNVSNTYGVNCTKDGYLLVQVSQNRTKDNRYDLVVDAFKDSVFINTFKMDAGKACDFYSPDYKRSFIGDKIYYLNRVDNYLKIYEY